MSNKTHTVSIVNFLCSDTVEERSTEYPDTYCVIKIHTSPHSHDEKSGYVNILVVEKPNKRTLQRSTCTLSRSPKKPSVSVAPVTMPLTAYLWY